MTTLYAHYVVRPNGVFGGGEVYVKVYDLTDDDRARVLAGAQIVAANDVDDTLFEFLSLVREEDLHPGVQVQNHVTFVFGADR